MKSTTLINSFNLLKCYIALVHKVAGVLLKMGSASTCSNDADIYEANLEPKEPILLNMRKKNDCKKLEKQLCG